MLDSKSRKDREHMKEIKKAIKYKNIVLEYFEDVKKYTKCEMNERNRKAWKRQSDALLLNVLRLYNCLQRIKELKDVKLSEVFSKDECVLYVKFEEYIDDIVNAHKDINTKCIKVVLDGRKLYKSISGELGLRGVGETNNELSTDIRIPFSVNGNREIELDLTNACCSYIEGNNNVIEVKFN